jgi:hypothetical protein
MLRENMFDELYERTESGMIVREVKHCCVDCGAVIEVHEHSSWQEIKDCQAGMRALCRECASWPGCPSAGADAGRR